MGTLAHLFVLGWFLIGIGAAQAGCAVPGPRPGPDPQPIEWRFVITSGQSCIQGLKLASMTLDSVVISSPAQFGRATVQGYGFAYTAPAKFKGEDSFSVKMVGENHRVPGIWIISVHVTIQ